MIGLDYMKIYFCGILSSSGDNSVQILEIWKVEDIEFIANSTNKITKMISDTGVPKQYLDIVR